MLTRKEVMRAMLRNSSGTYGIIEAKVRLGLQNRDAIRAFREAGLIEQKSSYLVAVVMLKGAKEETVKKTIDVLSRKNSKLQFELLHESDDPLKLPKGTDVVVFVANGSIKGVGRLLSDTEEIREQRRIGTVLVSEEKQGKGTGFDNVMTFDHAIERRQLTAGLKAAHYYQRGNVLQCA